MFSNLVVASGRPNGKMFKFFSPCEVARVFLREKDVRGFSEKEIEALVEIAKLPKGSSKGRADVIWREVVEMA